MASMVGGSASIDPLQMLPLDDIPTKLREFERVENPNTRRDLVDGTIILLVRRVIERHPVNLFTGELRGLLNQFSKIKNGPEEIETRKKIMLEMAILVESIRESEGWGLIRESLRQSLIQLPPLPIPAFVIPAPRRETSDLEQARTLAKLAKANSEIEKLRKENQDLQCQRQEQESQRKQIEDSHTAAVSQLEAKIAELTAEIATLRSTSSPSTVAAPAKRSP